MLTNVAGPGRYDVMKSMLLLVIDQLMIVCGIISAFTTILATKIILFILGCLFGIMLYAMTYFIFNYAQDAIEDEAAQPYIKYMSYCFYSCWLVYPTLFLLGSEGPANVMSAEVSAVGHAIADLIAKNAYSALSWYIRWNFVQAQLERNADKGLDSDSSTESGSESSDEEMAAPRKAKASGKKSKNKAKGLSVLLVDNASEEEEVAQIALENAGCSVTIEDPADASRALRKAYYDFVVVNCMTAAASGFAVVEAIRASKRAFSDVPVIAMTPRSTDSELKANIDEAEIDDVIVLGKKGISDRKLKVLLANIREGAIEKSESEADASSSEEEETRRSRSAKPKRAKSVKSAKVAKKSSRRGEEKFERSNSSGSVLSFLDGTVPDKVSKRSSSRSASKASKKRSKSRDGGVSRGNSKGREGGVSRASSSGSILAFLDGTKD